MSTKSEEFQSSSRKAFAPNVKSFSPWDKLKLYIRFLLYSVAHMNCERDQPLKRVLDPLEANFGMHRVTSSSLSSLTAIAADAAVEQAGRRGAVAVAGGRMHEPRAHLDVLGHLGCGRRADAGGGGLEGRREQHLKQFS